MSLAASHVLVDLRAVAPGQHHAAVLEAFGTLDVGEQFELHADGDRGPVYRLLQTRAPGDFAWNCLPGPSGERRVCVTKLSCAHGSGDCCSHCGGQHA